MIFGGSFYFTPLFPHRRHSAYYWSAPDFNCRFGLRRTSSL